MKKKKTAEDPSENNQKKSNEIHETAETESVKIESAVDIIKDQLELIMRSLSSGVSVCICHEDGTMEMIYANDRFYEQRGYTKKQFEKEIHHSMDLVYVEDIDQIGETTRIDKAKETFESVYRIVKRDHSIAWMRSRISFAKPDGNRYPLRIAITDDITSEQMTLAKIKEKDTFLQMILDNVGSGITASLLNEKSKDYLFANEQFYSMMGYTREQYQNEVKNLYQRIYPQDWDRVLNTSQSTRLLDKPTSIEYSVVCRDHAIKKVRMLSVNRRMDHSEQDIQLSVYTDITEESREEEKSKELIENLPCGAGIFDISGGKVTSVYLNHKYWELVGRRPDQADDFQIMDTIQLKDRSLIPMIIQKIITSRKEQECEIHVLHGDGRYIPLLMRANIMRQKPGKSMLYATYTSIEENVVTFRRMLPVAMETMMAASKDIFFIKDRALNYVCASRSFAMTAGIPDEKEIIGKTDYDLFSEEVADRFREEDERMMREGRPLIDYNEELPTENGYMRYMKTSKYLLHDSFRNVIGIYGISRDIS
ncbi:MAG: PAS domain-containing protein [bacterium]|nr:PAS domain-containing protein [bacterium]